MRKMQIEQKHVFQLLLRTDISRPLNLEIALTVRQEPIPTSQANVRAHLHCYDYENVI